jgi:Signal peptidase, peptidase S26/Yip1 domain
VIEETAAADARIRPWLSAFFLPRKTIRQVAGSTPAPAFLALCAAIGAFRILLLLALPPLKDLRDWHQIAVLVLFSILGALILVYVKAALIRIAGRLMGSVCERARLRNALAWSAVPLGWGVLVSAALLFLPWQTDDDVVTIVASVLLGVAGVWSFAVTVAMLMEVQKLNVMRAFVCYAGVSLFIVIAVVLPVRIFLWQPFNILSNGSAPAVIDGDYLFVSKYSYGYSRYSFPFGLNLFSGRIFFSQPERADAIVFKNPTDN